MSHSEKTIFLYGEDLPLGDLCCPAGPWWPRLFTRLWGKVSAGGCYSDLVARKWLPLPGGRCATGWRCITESLPLGDQALTAGWTPRAPPAGEPCTGACVDRAGPSCCAVPRGRETEIKPAHCNCAGMSCYFPQGSSLGWHNPTHSAPTYVGSMPPLQQENQVT